jgi:imidazolonepropionase-like amidohydrolase
LNPSTSMGSIDPDTKNTDVSSACLIIADLLIPGRGEPLKDAALIFNDKRIVYVGSKDQIPERYAALSPINLPVVMPGLWDCHVHMLGHIHFSGTAIWNLNPVTAGARLIRDAAELLNAGFTTVRDCGGHGLLIDRVIQEGHMPGPKIYSCNALISQTGGHADNHELPLNVWKDACEKRVPCHLCDGPDECQKAVRLQLREGADFIKICASGGVGSPRDDPEHRQFSDQELEIIVAEAARAERVVAAHAHGKSGIIAALNAGARTIEHGTYLDEESIKLMVEKGAVLVATRAVNEAFKKSSHLLNPESLEKFQKIEPQRRAAYAAAIKGGVKIALGTDFGVSIPGHHAAHGANGLELKCAVDAGMTPLQAIEAGTANGPLTLGPRAPLSGELREGFDADFIALARNPLDDIEILTNSENITHVWRGGKLYKSPGLPVVTSKLQK